MLRTRETFLTDNICKRYSERGVAIDAVIAWMDKRHYMDTHTPECAYRQAVSAEAADFPNCNCGFELLLAELQRVADPKEKPNAA